MKTTGSGYPSRVLLALLASIALCSTSRAAPPNPETVRSLGIEAQALSEDWRTREGYRAGGVLVTAVAAGSAAAGAGLEPGDILVSIGSRVLLSPDDLRAAEAAVELGRPVSVVVARDAGRRIRIFNIDAARHAEAETSAPPRPATTEFGMRCDNLGWERALELGAPEGLGVLVRLVNGGSTAEAAGIAAGDVVTFAAGKPVANVDELESIITDAQSPLAFVTVRRGTTRWLTAEFVTPTPPATAQIAEAGPASAGGGSVAAAVDVASNPAPDSGTPPPAVDAAASLARDSATPGPATAAGVPPAAVAPVSSATVGSQAATDARVAALHEEVMSLREEVRKLREEIAKLAR